ncbi:MAG: hypothetical protein H8E37_07365, partial [Planctomycetes bacterium]|nr:hypothetical protein [Planctomycetota bacterium]
MTTPTIQQREIPESLFGPLVEFQGDVSSEAAVQSHLAEHGYCPLRGVLDRNEVLAARREVFERLESVGEIRSPCEDGIATRESRRSELHPDANAFWQSVSEGPLLRAVTHGERIRKLMATL